MEISSIGSFLDYWRTIRGRTRRVVACIPPDQIEWSPHPGKSFFDRLGVESQAIFGTLTDADLERKCLTPAGTPITTWKWLRAMVEHEAHHRGQIYLMLGLLNVPTPPLYGMTSEEVQARSAGGPVE
ncbi:MAG: DinB family protein [Gemmatimonadetes bacterium]|nr:MAG: DinB family protein [Gemmatimonadota bacterium]